MRSFFISHFISRDAVDIVEVVEVIDMRKQLPTTSILNTKSNEPPKTATKKDAFEKKIAEFKAKVKSTYIL